MDADRQRIRNETQILFDSINILLTTGKPAGAGTCFRTAIVFGLKDASIGAILNEKRVIYATAVSRVRN